MMGRTKQSGVFEHAKMQLETRITPAHALPSSGHLHSIYTFYSVEWFC